MKKILFFIMILGILSISLLGCGTENRADTVKFGEGETFYGEVNKHDTTKTAEIKAFIEVSGSDELNDYKGEQVYMAPVWVNFLCDGFNRMFFSPEEFTPSEEAKKGDSDLWGHLEGYEVTKFSLTLIATEDLSKIAKCVSTGKDTLKFTAYKDYPAEQTAEGTEIGVFI